MRLFKRDPATKLEKAYRKKLVEMRDTQRAGDIQRLAELTEESQELRKQIESLTLCT